MSNFAKIVVGIVALLAVSAAVATYHGQSFSGTTSYQKQSFTEGFYAGSGRQVEVTRTGAGTFTSALFNGGVTFSSTFATSSQGAATYTAANITGVNTILHNATAALTATLPASSTLTSFVPNTGDRASITLVNIGAGAITFAAGTGMNLYNASSTLVLPATAAAQFEFVRQADTDIAVFYSPGS